MTPLDDNDLIDRLQSAIAEHQSDITAPEGIGDAARRAARRRTATRAVSAGVPLLAAAGVATVLATSPGSGSTAASGPVVGGSALTVPSGPVKGRDTAYVIKRVKAKVADDIQGGTMVHSFTYASGSDSEGSLINLGQETEDGYEYTAPDGDVSSRNAIYDQTSGSLQAVLINDFSPDARGRYGDRRTIIYPGNQTYRQDEYPGLADPDTTPQTPNLFSSPSEVQQALQKGRVTQSGTTTLNGTQAVALSVKVPSGSSMVSTASGTHAVSTDLTLYVDAQTYRPLRTTLSFGGYPGLMVSDWVPATPQTITQATDDSIPAGYSRVDHGH